MQILGIGTLFAQGYGISSLEQALENGLIPSADTNAPPYRVDFDSVPDKSLLKKLRRADKLSKMSVLAAAAAMQDANMDTSVIMFSMWVEAIKHFAEQGSGNVILR